MLLLNLQCESAKNEVLSAKTEILKRSQPGKGLEAHWKVEIMFPSFPFQNILQILGNEPQQHVVS